MKKKGFTLIELLAVIVILAVIALISMPIILNVVEKARKGTFEDSAYGVVDAARIYYASGYLDGNGNEEIFTFPNDTKLKLSGTKPKSGSVKLEKDGKVAIAISNGQWCAVKDNNEEKVRITDYSIGDCEIGDVEKPNTPESCFTVNPEDPSEITGYTCTDTKVTIPSSINGVEIKKIGDNAFKDKGLTEVIIPEGIEIIGNSAFEGNYLTQVTIPSTVTTIGDNAFKNNQLTDIILNEGLKQIGNSAFEGNQLTNVKIPESVETIGDNAFKNNQLESVEIPEETIIGNGAFEGNNLSSTDQTKAEIKNVDIQTTSTTITITVDAEVGNFGKIKTYEYNIDGGSYEEGTRTFSFEGLDFDSTHTIGIKVTTDSGLVTEKSVEAKTDFALLSVTANGYTGVYDGASHGITVSSSEATIKYGTSEGTYNLESSPTYTDVGTYTVYYQVTKAGYKTVTGSKEIVISKAEGTVTLSETSGSLTYPTAKTITVTKNTGGTLSCSSSNSNVATCSVSGTKVTITPGTTAGTATITVTSAATTNYNAASASYTATVTSGILSVTANGYTGTYDGQAHGISVSSSGATIKYGTSEGTYNLESSPTYTGVGTYTVYYEVTRAGYKTVTGSKTVVINKASGSISLSETSGSLTYPNTKTITVTKNTGGGTLSCSSSNSNVATCQVSGTTITIRSGATAGTATITVTSAATTNYNAASASYAATVSSGTLSVTANGYTGMYDGNAHGITVSSSGATIKYGTASGTYNLTSSPTYTSVGTYTVYYQVTRAGYKTVTGSKTVVINKANGSVSLSATSGSLTYPNTKTITVTKNTGGGTLSCSTSNTSIATCQVSGTTITIRSGTTAGTATITVTSAATTNYNAASASYTITVASGTLSVTANGWSGIYDGNAHGITVTSSGATIKYGTTAGTYNLTSSPTFTDAGTHTVYYQVTKPGYKTVTGSKDVVIMTERECLSSAEANIPAGSTVNVTSARYYSWSNPCNLRFECTPQKTNIAGCEMHETSMAVYSNGTSGSTQIIIKAYNSDNSVINDFTRYFMAKVD